MYSGFQVVRREDGLCAIVLNEGGRVTAVAACPPGTFPTPAQVDECRRAMLGKPVNLNETC